MDKTDSIVTGYTSICFFCGKPAECEHHLLFGNGTRKLAEEDGLKVPACNQCHTLGPVTGRVHDNPMAEKLSKCLGQAIFEIEIGGRQDFITRYGRSYLWEAHVGRKINEDKYGISEKRYKELVYFCLQYNEWKKWLEQNQGVLAGHVADGQPYGRGGHSDPVAAFAAKREKFQRKCKAVETAAEETSPLFAGYIIKHVTNGDITYKYLNMVLHMPCSKKKYYELRRKFFWLLDKKLS